MTPRHSGPGISHFTSRHVYTVSLCLSLLPSLSLSLGHSSHSFYLLPVSPSLSRSRRRGRVSGDLTPPGRACTKCPGPSRRVWADRPTGVPRESGWVQDSGSCRVTGLGVIFISASPPTGGSGDRRVPGPLSRVTEVSSSFDVGSHPFTGPVPVSRQPVVSTSAPGSGGSTVRGVMDSGGTPGTPSGRGETYHCLTE